MSGRFLDEVSDRISLEMAREEAVRSESYLKQMVALDGAELVCARSDWSKESAWDHTMPLPEPVPIIEAIRREKTYLERAKENVLRWSAIMELQR